MATRKKRLRETLPLPDNQPKERVVYQDKFQERTNKRIEEVGRKFRGRGKTIIYALAALAVLAILGGIIYSWNRRTSGSAQGALGKAIETAQAVVTTQPIPPTFSGKTFKSEKERAEAAIAEFQSVADKYGSPTREKAQYFVAVNRLSLDRPAAVGELENLTKTSGEVGTLAKFALAQALQGDGKLDEAAALYAELAQMNDSIISKDTINFALASIYEKQGKTEEAANLYFQIADEASRARDLEGSPLPMGETARQAKERLQALNPAWAAEIKEETPVVPPAM